MPGGAIIIIYGGGTTKALDYPLPYEVTKGAVFDNQSAEDVTLSFRKDSHRHTHEILVLAKSLYTFDCAGEIIGLK